MSDIKVVAGEADRRSGGVGRLLAARMVSRESASAVVSLPVGGVSRDTSAYG